MNYIGDVPRGKVVWGFDTTDMAKAKAALKDMACISGNMPIAQLAVGKPKEIRETLKSLSIPAPGRRLYHDERGGHRKLAPGKHSRDD